MAQFLRPDSNLTQSNFTNGFAEIDETTPVDTDFAYSAINTTAVLQVTLSNASTPGSGTTTIRYRIARTNGAVVDGTGSDSTVTVELRQGATTIATDTTRSTTGTWTTFTWTPDVSAVTDWTDLRLYVTVVGGSGSPANRRGAGISWAEVEAPDPLVLGTGDGSSTSTSSASAELLAFDAEAGTSTSTSTASGDLIASGVFDGSSTSTSTASGEFVGSFNSDGSSVSTSTATGDVVWYFISTGSSTSNSTADGVLSGSVFIDGSATSTSVAYAVGWDGIFRTPGDLINDLEPNGWLSNSTSLNDAIDEETDPDDSDVIWSPSYASSPQTTLFDIEPLSGGNEYICKIRARASNSTPANIKLMLYFDTTFVTETALQLLTTTLTTYTFSVTPSGPVNRVRIHVEAA